MPTSYYAGIDVVSRDSDGYRSPLASESVRIRNAATGTLLTTVTSGAGGWLAGGSLSVDPGTEIEFYSATKTGAIRQITAESAADAVATQVTLVLDDEFVATTPSHFADIYITDDEGGVAPIFLGSQAKGTTVKYPLESAFNKNLKVFAASRTKNGDLADSALYEANFDAIAPSSTRPQDKIEVDVTAVFGGSGRLLYDNAGTLGAVVLGSGLTLSGGTLSAATGITIGSTAISSGTNGRVLYQAGGAVQQSGNLAFNGNVFSVATSSATETPLTITGAASQTADYVQVRRSTGVNLLTLAEDSVGGRLNIHANNGSLIGFYRINPGGASSGLDVAGFNQLTLVNQGSTTANLLISSRGSSGGVIGVNWNTFSGQTFAFQAFGGSGGEVLFRDESATTVHVYHDRTSANRGLWMIGGKIDLANSVNIVCGTGAGSQIATATGQKIGFWGKTPIVQPTTGITGATRVGGAGTNITTTDTFGGYTVAQIAAALINSGILA